MESVEFLMLTDVRIAFVALPRSLLARPVNHENITGASLKVAPSQFGHATFIILYLNVLGLFSEGWRKQILSLLSLFGFLPKPSTMSNLVCSLQGNPEDELGWLLALLRVYSSKRCVFRGLHWTPWKIL